ncbi:unnamed protein product [Protopolystoma xenopodis]|uniref:Uncharacterized protein n=1 Tax=Protopolystoma xenopodis TaxID=117903 RepID=A0A448XP49_9PLAT|nr:unnamed protein product [Protopolystoma xenopodis]
MSQENSPAHPRLVYLCQNVPVKLKNEWSREIRRRLLVGSMLESGHQTLLLKMKMSSTK